MATQKSKPEPGIPEQQDRRRRRQQQQTHGNVGVYALVTTVVVVVTAAAFALWSSSRTPDAATPVQPEVLVPAVSAPTDASDTETGLPLAHGKALPFGHGKMAYLLDLKTGEMTPLPKSIDGRWLNGYAISPDGSEVAYLGPAEDGGRRREVFVARLDGRHIRQITHDARHAQPAWSPDGTTIAYVGGPTRLVKRNIFVIDLTSGVTTQVTFETGGASDPQFSPDGSSIVYTANHPHYDQVRIVPVTGGKGRRLVGGRGSSASGASLSPDGSLLSYICEGHLCLANADGSDPSVTRSLTDAECTQFLHIDSCVIVAGPSLFAAPPSISSASAGIATASWSPDGSRLASMNYEAEWVDVIDVTTGETTGVARGAWPRWVDDRTLIVEGCNCPH